MTLYEIKTHLRVTHDTEDLLIAAYLEAAMAHVTQYLGIDELEDPVPSPIRAAVMLLTADLFVNRERQADKVLYDNPAYQLLLNPYRDMAVLP